MNSISLINKVKYSKTLYRLFRFCGDIFIKVLSLFIRQDKKLILFVSFGGRKYDDSPRCIFEKMILDDRFNDYKFVWAFIDPELHQVSKRAEVIKIDTLRYFLTCLKARVWITNSAITRGLSFKSRWTLYLNTWHGSPIKKMGDDINPENTSFRGQTHNLIDIMLSQSQFESQIFSRVFNIPTENFRVYGLPRNDELISRNTTEEILKIKTQLNIPLNKQVILYAPTFREYTKDSNSNCIIAPPINFEHWEQILGDKYIVLFRAHYEVVNVMNIKYNNFVRNLSQYPNLNDLMLISDMLISDYSSIFFDYSILARPMLCFAYDYDQYSSKRGLYFDIRKELSQENYDTEDKLLNAILNLNIADLESISNSFREKYIEEYGDATYKTINEIAQNIISH